MKINYEEVLDYQKFWKESESLTDKQKEGYMILSNKLIERALRNDGEIDNIYFIIQKIMQILEFLLNLPLQWEPAHVLVKGKKAD